MMKRITRSVLTGIALILFLASNAQKVNPAIIENIPESYAWDIVYQSFMKHNKKLTNYDQQTQTAKSDYYRYTSFVIENRARFQVTYINGNIEIQFVDKQYLSEKGWVNNLLPTSKGIKKKYIYPIAKTIRERSEKMSANSPPVAVFTLNPSSGSVTTVIEFDASASHDAEDNSTGLKVRWDWENDGNWDTQWSTTKTVQHLFIKQGVYTVKMEVMDTYGVKHDATHRLSMQNFLACPDQPIITYKGQTYNTVLIGEHCWMKENLNAGIMISGSVPMTNNGIIEKYCYNNNPVNCDIYGGLYQWNELMKYTKQDSIGICPKGWQIPSESDFQNLVRNLGGMEVAGSKLKEAISIRWQGDTHAGTNESGFTALGSGTNNDTFTGLGISAYFANLKIARPMILEYNSHLVKWENVYDNKAVSVRCIKSEERDDDENEEKPIDELVDDNETPLLEEEPDEEPVNEEPQKGVLEGDTKNPTQTNCPKKEYLLYFPFNDKAFKDSLDNIASRGYKLKLGNFAFFFFEKEENSSTMYPIKLLESVERISIDELNELAKDNWVVVNSFLLTYLIQDENAPIYEYTLGKELSNSYIHNYKHYFSGGNNIHDLNDLYGDKAWELVSINGAKSLFRRIVGSNIKYEYKSLILTIEDQNNDYLRVKELGAAGWQYCTHLSIVRGLTGSMPLILKKRQGQADAFSFELVVIDNPDEDLPQYINIVGKPEKERQMVEAFEPMVWNLNNFGQAGWVYKMFVEHYKDEGDNNMIILVYQVPENCR